MKHLIKLLACCLPLQAQAETCKWSGMYVDISPTQEGNVSVHFHNELTSSWGDSPFYCIVTIDGEIFRAVITAGNGEIPDNILIEHPVGWQAMPEQIDVKEGDDGYLLVTPILLG